MLIWWKVCKIEILDYFIKKVKKMIKYIITAIFFLFCLSYLSCLNNDANSFYQANKDRIDINSCEQRNIDTVIKNRGIK